MEEQVIDEAEIAEDKPARLETPHALRRIFGSHAPAIHQLIVLDPRLADFVALQDKAGVHLLALAVSYSLPEKPAEQRIFAVMLRTTARAKLLSHILGCVPPPGLAGVLGRLCVAPMPRDYYLSLVTLMEEPRARKVLTHAPRITRALLDGLGRLRPWLRMPNLARIAGDPDDWRHLCFSLAAIKRNRPDLDDAALRASMKAVEDLADIWSWRERLLTRRPFAAPPWKGDYRLRPVCDRRSLREVAERFDNCLAEHHMLDAVFGRRFYYVWEAEEPCVVEIRPDDLVGWLVGQIEGLNHSSPTPKTRERIVKRLLREGIFDYGDPGTGFHDEF